MQHNVTDNLDLLLAILPPQFLKFYSKEKINESDLLELIFDLGRVPQVRLQGDREIFLGKKEVTYEDLQFMADRIGGFDEDNRSGITRTLHRISAILNRRGEVVGLTCRVGRAVYGVIDIIKDLVESGRSILILGAPGVGKTTMLRESARILAGDLNKRVVVIDTSNEIAGDGDIPLEAIGKARRMQVRVPSEQHKVMIEAVENHMPQVVVIDEIGVAEETFAARTIAERGVQLIGTAHGMTLQNLTQNPTLVDLVGGIQTVTLSDEEAYRRRTQKSVLERMRPPTFDVIVEIIAWGQVRIHADTAKAVDALLAGKQTAVETRSLDEKGSIVKEEGRSLSLPALNTAFPVNNDYSDDDGSDMRYFDEQPYFDEKGRSTKIYLYGIKRRIVETVIKQIGASVVVSPDIEDAQALLMLKGAYKRRPKYLRKAETQGIPVYLLREETELEIGKILERVVV